MKRELERVKKCKTCKYSKDPAMRCSNPLICTNNNLWRECSLEVGGSEMINKDMVNHPDHYKTKNGLETIDVIEAFTDGLNGIEASDTANIIKYACRWKKKNGIEDLRKIRWYVDHLIKHLDPEDGVEHVDDNVDNYFKCPLCGGAIKRCITDISHGTITARSLEIPTCIGCGTHYSITVKEDLSYDIIPD